MSLKYEETKQRVKHWQHISLYITNKSSSLPNTPRTLLTISTFLPVQLLFISLFFLRQVIKQTSKTNKRPKNKNLLSSYLILFTIFSYIFFILSKNEWKLFVDEIVLYFLLFFLNLFKFYFGIYLIYLFIIGSH